MKRLLACAAAVLSIAMWTPTAANAAIELKLGHVCPATGDRLEQAAQVFKKYVEEKTGGEIVVKTFPASQLGGEREMLESIQMGTLECGTITNAPFSNFLKETLVFDIPFVFSKAEHAHRVLDGEFGQYLLGLVEKRMGVKALVFGENGLRHFTTTKVAAHTPKDLAGLKLRVMENPVHMEMIRGLGAIPTPMAFAELYTALAQGVVDGQENPIALNQSMRFYEVQKYMIKTGHLYAPYIFVLSNDFYNSLSEKHQQIILDGAKLWRKTERELNAKQCESGEEFMKSKGLTIIELSPEEYAQFQKATKSAEQMVRKSVGDAIVNRFMKAVDAAK